MTSIYEGDKNNETVYNIIAAKAPRGLSWTQIMKKVDSLPTEESMSHTAANRVLQRLLEQDRIFKMTYALKNNRRCTELYYIYEE